MAAAADASVTDLLQAWGAGDETARDALLPLVYEHLRKIAQNRLRGDAGATLQATGLVHEAYLRLVDQDRARWQNRAHFFAIASRVMRRIMVDHYRACHAQKRGDPAKRVPLENVDVAAEADRDGFDLDLLTRALDRLAVQDERQAKIVELRFFGGLTLEETAEAADLSTATVKREWVLARAWLKREMDGEGGPR